MHVDLPTRPADTDGALLRDQSQHALVLDMITRSDTVWPRYGTSPGYDQPGIGSDGFQEIFTATMMASLEWGLFPYAEAVLDNWLTYFIQEKGFVLYRGLEMAQHGRMLTNIAQYYTYTKDSSMLIKHLGKIEGIAWMLMKRRSDALAKYPKSDSRYTCAHAPVCLFVCLFVYLQSGGTKLAPSGGFQHSVLRARIGSSVPREHAIKYLF